MLERQTNILRGKLSGWSGSSQPIFSRPVLQALDHIILELGAGGLRFARPCQRVGCSCGADGSQPMRSARTLWSIMLAAILGIGSRQRRKHFFHVSFS